MARSVVLLLLVACSTCMETRETVQRMVMVRTTGSDLQPAATGFIYKKESDGAASVVKMGESEVMEKLTKLYEQPKSFAAPIPIAAGPFYAKNDEKLPSHSESKVIPVVEKQDDDKQHIAGIANDDYEKLLGDYSSKFGDNSDFDEYLKSLGYSDDGDYHGLGASNDDERQNDKDKKEYGSEHEYESSGGADYDSGKYESYAMSSGEGEQKKIYDATDGVGDQYPHIYKNNHSAHKVGTVQGDEGDGFHGLFDNTEYQKDHDFNDGETIQDGHFKLNDGHTHHESGGRSEEGDEDETRFDEDDFAKGGFHIKPSAGQRNDRASDGHETARGHGNVGSDFSSSYHYKITH